MGKTQKKGRVFKAEDVDVNGEHSGENNLPQPKSES
eukprot:COSAG06_NODE_858_length_11909_cov_6.018036_15_plen_36_part_00